MTEEQPIGRSPTAAEQFLLAEFQSLRDMRLEAGADVDKRIDTLIAVVTALGAGLGLLSQLNIAKTIVLLVAIVSTSSLLSISITTFRQIILNDIAATIYTHAINRIRYYFGTHSDVDIRDYILLPYHVDYPRYGKFTRNQVTIGALSCLLAAGLTTSLYMWWLNTDLTSADVQMVGVASVVVLGMTLFLYALRRRSVATSREKKYLKEGQLWGVMEALETGKPILPENHSKGSPK